jgi:hypothetical protein
MGAQSYNYSHTWEKPYLADMPQAIDGMGFWFPNSRSYDFVELAALQ